MSFGNIFNPLAGTSFDPNSAQSSNRFSTPGLLSNNDTDDINNLAGVDLSPFRQQLSDAMQQLTSPFTKVQMMLDTIHSKQALNDDNIKTMSDELFTVAQQLIAFLNANGPDQQRLMELKSTLTGLHELGAEYGSSSAIFALSELYATMPETTDQLASGFLFQYIEITNFQMTGYKKSHPNTSTEELQTTIAVNQMQMLLALKKHAPDNTKASDLFQRLKRHPSIQQSMDLLRDAYAELIQDIEEGITATEPTNKPENDLTDEAIPDVPIA